MNKKVNKDQLIELMEAEVAGLVAYWRPPCSHVGPSHSWGEWSYEVSTGHRKAIAVNKNSAEAVLRHYDLSLPKRNCAVIKKNGKVSVSPKHDYQVWMWGER